MTGRQHAAIGVALAAPVGATLATGLVASLMRLLVDITPVGRLPVGSGLPLAALVLLLTLGGGLLGALLPDLDTSHSLLEAAPLATWRRLRRWPMLWLLAAPVLLLLAGCLALLNGLLMLVTAHRGLTHSLVGLALATALVALLTAWAVGPALALGLAAGYLSHLLADMLTPQGIRLAAPFSDRSWHLLPRPLRFGGDSRRAGCLAPAMLVAGLTVAAWLVLRSVGAGA